MDISTVFCIFFPTFPVDAVFVLFPIPRRFPVFLLFTTMSGIPHIVHFLFFILPSVQCLPCFHLHNLQFSTVPNSQSSQIPIVHTFLQFPIFPMLSFSLIPNITRRFSYIPKIPDFTVIPPPHFPVFRTLTIFPFSHSCRLLPSPHIPNVSRIPNFPLILLE